MACLADEVLHRLCVKCGGRGGPMCTAVCLNVALLIFKEEEVELTEEGVERLIGFPPEGLPEIAGDLYGRRVSRKTALARLAEYICRKI